ncbi:MAG: creatininase family protein [Opitutaceae bacterium]|nr:creatininase family protein [Opitutaceae bacterium]
MNSPRLSTYACSASWENRPWTRFAEAEVAVLPVCSYGVVPAGMSLDFEEELLGSILADCFATGLPEGVLVLPPLRFTHVPHPQARFSISDDEARQLLREVALSVKVAGVRKLVFVVSGPWHQETVLDCSRDIRVDTGLITSVVPLKHLGIDLSPAAPVGKQRSLRPGDVKRALDQKTFAEARQYLTDAARQLRLVLLEVAGAAFSDAPKIQDHAPARKPARSLTSLNQDQLAAAARANNALVVIPIGAIEQHGLHLPVGVDSMLGLAYLDQALANLSTDQPVWAGMPITYGKSTEHQAFPGTVTVSAASLRAMVKAQVHGLRRLGFQRFAFLNTHGGNSLTLVALSRELEAEGAGEVGLLNHLWKPELSSPREAAYGFHAGEWETSLMLALAPDLVAMDKAVCEYPAGCEEGNRVKPEGGTALLSWATGDVSRSGVMGDATQATKEKGERWLKAYVDSLVARIEELMR